VVAVLYNDILRKYPDDPENEERDRFILSKGHACSAVYAALAETGFFPVEELNDQCQDGSRLSGHVTYYNVPGAELSTGSLGHGCCVAAGMALSGKKKNMPYRVYALVGDGECDEGSVWEMALFAHQYKLGNLCVIVDNNKMQAMGYCAEVADHIDLAAKWKAFGWDVKQIDGHNHSEIRNALNVGGDGDVPICIIANTIKGKGVSFMENNLLWHYRDPQGQDYQNAICELESK
jgi:transketolase